VQLIADVAPPAVPEHPFTKFVGRKGKHQRLALRVKKQAQLQKVNDTGSVR
jgi:hypothetical protein